MPILNKPDGIIFDCDSTLSKIEGIDELAKLKSKEKEIVDLTNQAMDGFVPLEDIYAKRLDIIKPSYKEVDSIAQAYIREITEGTLDLIHYLQQENIKIAIISGGIRIAILPFARFIGISEEDTHAVELNFDEEGNYQNVIPSPLTTSNGKQLIAKQFKDKYQLKNVYLVGDGMSDVAAKGCNAADKIIGYGGVIYREKVAKEADVFYNQENLLFIKNYWEK